MDIVQTDMFHQLNTEQNNVDIFQADRSLRPPVVDCLERDRVLATDTSPPGVDRLDNVWKVRKKQRNMKTETRENLEHTTETLKLKHRSAVTDSSPS